MGNNGGNGGRRPDPPAMPDLSQSPEDREAWLDFYTAAIRGYSSCAWSKDGKQFSLTSATIVSSQAAETADRAFGEYRQRVKG